MPVTDKETLEEITKILDILWKLAPFTCYRYFFKKVEEDS